MAVCLRKARWLSRKSNCDPVRTHLAGGLSDAPLSSLRLVKRSISQNYLAFRVGSEAGAVGACRRPNVRFGWKAELRSALHIAVPTAEAHR